MTGNRMLVGGDGARVGTMVAMPDDPPVDGRRLGHLLAELRHHRSCPSRNSVFSGRYVHNHGVLTQASWCSSCQTTATPSAGRYSPPLDGGSPLAADGGLDVLLFGHWRDLVSAPSVPTWAALHPRGFQCVEDELPGAPAACREYDYLRKDPGMERNLLGVGAGSDPPVAPLAVRLATAFRCIGRACP